MQHVNWFGVTIISIWACATIGVGLTNDSSCFDAAFFATVIMGIGYFLSHND